MNPPPVSLIGWLHSLACILAMGVGTWQVLARAGTRSHKQRGDWYVATMLVANLTALAIYDSDVLLRPGQGPFVGPVFGVFHWAAVLTLVILAAGWFAGKNQRHAFFAYLHPICMIVTWWFLMGGAINEGFHRVDWLRDLAMAMSPQAERFGQLRLLLIAHFVLELLVAVALVMAIVQVRRRRRRTRAHAHPASVAAG